MGALQAEEIRMRTMSKRRIVCCMFGAALVGVPRGNTRLTDGSSCAVDILSQCGAPGAGVSLSIPEGDSATRAFDGFRQAKTTAAGLACVLNVPEGNVSITATLGDGREIATATILACRGFAMLTDLAPNR
jgi:hypothetical protein